MTIREEYEIITFDEEELQTKKDIYNELAKTFSEKLLKEEDYITGAHSIVFSTGIYDIDIRKYFYEANPILNKDFAKVSIYRISELGKELIISSICKWDKLGTILEFISDANLK